MPGLKGLKVAIIGLSMIEAFSVNLVVFGSSVVSHIRIFGAHFHVSSMFPFLVLNNRLVSPMSLHEHVVQ